MIKRSLLVLVLSFSIATLAQNKPHQKKLSTDLVGYISKSDFLQEPYNSWFETKYEAYKANTEVVKKIRKKLKKVTVLGFMGTWCGDSKRETPRFYKIMEQAGFNFKKNLKLVAVNRSKKTPNNLQEGHDIIRVPTFIFYKKGKEIGRFVEYPRETLEKDILAILSGKKYKHSYQE